MNIATTQDKSAEDTYRERQKALDDLLNMQPEDLVRTMQALRAELEASRRGNQPLISSGPMDGVFDYSSAGSLIDVGVAHLDEGLPNGQKTRVELGFYLLQAGTILMGRWLRKRGFDVVQYKEEYTPLKANEVKG